MSLLACTECDMAPYLSTPCQIYSQDDLLPLLSLDQSRDDSSVKKFTVPNSTVVLSRVCVNYLSSKATFSDWSICRQHKLELLDHWVAPSTCCHHQHVDTGHQSQADMGAVTYAMSKTILKTDSMVLPIGGAVCKTCKDNYIKQYIPALTSIKDIKTNNNTEEKPKTITNILTPEEILRKLSSLTPVPPVTFSDNLLDPAEKTDGDTAERVTSPGSDDSITIKDERIEYEEEENESISTLSIEVAAPAPADSLPPTEDRTEEREADTDKEGTEKEETEGHDEFKFYCKLCHIGFLKETSYKYHLANNIELHRKAKSQKNTVKKCDDCGKTFKDDIMFRKHMYNKHKVDDPHFCKLCNIVLKSESAYKSHYSKLHLERRTKIFYCRECGDIFNCRLEHQQHIKTHWVELKDSQGNQCQTCGKVFGSGNKSAYVKHLATHDDDSQNPCDCPTCENLEKSPSSKKRRRVSQKGSPKKIKQSSSDLLSKISQAFDQSLAGKENDVDNPEEMNTESEEVSATATDDVEIEKDTDNNEMNLDVNCGVCGKTFDNIDALESHIEEAHSKPAAEKAESGKVSKFVAKEGGWKCHLCGLVLRTSRQLKAHKSRKECSVLKEAEKVTAEAVEKEKPVEISVSSVRTYNNAGWQQSESRNWAAEFGYNKNSEDEEEDLSDIAQSKAKTSFKPKDILSAMKLNFSANLTDSTSEDEEEDEGDAFLKDGRSVSMKNREPRVLSEASRQTRKRLEVLTKQAQEVMKEREKAKGEKRKQTRESRSDETSPNNNKENENVDATSEEENLRSDGDNDLLIPLANGWVCEKTRDRKTQFWSPEGLSFESIQEIEKYSEAHNTSVDVSVFREAVDTVNLKAKTSEKAGLATVRIKDEETGLPMVIIFPGGSDCLTMDVSATA